MDDQYKRVSRNRRVALTMSEENPSVGFGRSRSSTCRWFANLKVGLDVDEGSLLDVLQEGVQMLVEAQNPMPGRSTLWAS